MVIDIHTFPGFLQEICGDPQTVAFRREQYFLYKQHIWPLELFVLQLDAAGIDKAVISAEDVTRGGRSSPTKKSENWWTSAPTV